MSSNDRGRYRSEPADLVQRVIDLERRLSALERTPRLGNASINKGALVVTDPNGIVRVQVGLLDDGTYGLQVREPADGPLYTVPFQYVNTVPATPGTGDSCTSTTYVDLATFGPSVTVPVRPSGRLLILATSQIQWNTISSNSTQNEGRFDVAFSGANTRNPNETNDPLVGVAKQLVNVSTGTNACSAIYTITATALFEGLNPGNTTVTMKYRNNNGATNSSEFFRRTLVCTAL